MNYEELEVKIKKAKKQVYYSVIAVFAYIWTILPLVFWIPKGSHFTISIFFTGALLFMGVIVWCIQSAYTLVELKDIKKRNW
jgi:hypothetical protein